MRNSSRSSTLAEMNSPTSSCGSSNESQVSEGGPTICGTARTGFRVFIDEGIEASSMDAQDFTALAVHQLGAIGFFREASDSPALYLAVHEPVA